MPDKKIDKSKDDNPQAKLARKWGKTIIDFKWTGVPNLLIDCQQKLGLNPMQMNILLILLKHWWTAGNYPFPSKQRMAEITGRDKSTIQKNIKLMENKGLIVRERRSKATGGQDTNRYDLQGLVDRLKVLAKEQKAINKKREDEDGRRRRGRQ